MTVNIRPKRQDFYRSYTLRWAAIAALTLLGVWLTVKHDVFVIWRTNLWSLKYVRSSYRTTTYGSRFGQPPDKHYRGRIWLAKDALAAGNPQKAEKLLAPVVDIDDPYIYSTLGAALDIQRYTNAAIEAWTKAGDWRSLYDAGNRALAENRGEDALAYRKAAYRLNPKTGAEPLANTIWQVRQDAAAAAAVLQQTLKAYPNAPQRLSWLRLLGDLEQRQQNWIAAEKIYQQVLSINPVDSATYISLGWLFYRRDGDLTRALMQFRKAIELNPEDGRAYHAVGMVLKEENRFQEADEWLTLALARSPKNQWWYLDWAGIALAHGDVDRAIWIYEKSVRRFPKFARAYSELAWAYSLAGRNQDAIEAIEHALFLENSNANFWARAGRIYEITGFPKNALKAYTRALQLEPGHPYAGDGLQRLRDH